MTALNQTGGLGDLRRRIFDRLRLIKNHVVECDFFELKYVPTDGAIGRQDQVGSCQLAAQLAPLDSGVFEHVQPRGKPGSLLVPVEDQRARYDDEGGPLCDPPLTPVLEKGQQLDGFPQPHVVSEAAAEPKFIEKTKPRHAGSLVRTKFPIKPLRRISRLDSRELGHPRSQLVELLIERDRSLGSQQRIQEPHLRFGKPYGLAVGNPQAGQ